VFVLSSILTNEGEFKLIWTYWGNRYKHHSAIRMLFVALAIFHIVPSDGIVCKWHEHKLR